MNTKKVCINMENKFVIDDAFSADEYNELTESSRLEKKFFIKDVVL